MRKEEPRLGVQQRVLPSYRVPFFDTLPQVFPQGVSVFAGQPRPEEMIDCGTLPNVAEYYPAENRHILRGLFYVCVQQNILEWLESWQPDVLVMASNPREIRNMAAMRWMHARQRPVIGWGLGAPTAGTWQQKVRDFAFNDHRLNFDALIAYSQQGAEEYARLGFSDKRIFVAPNAVTSRPTHTIPIRAAGFRDDRALVLFVGRLQARKRVDVLLRTCAALPERERPDLWIVGDGPERVALEALAGEVYPRARFHGALYGPDLAPLFSRADLFVLPGTGGLAVQEAMSFALPVIVAEADGTQSNLVRPENGWTIPAGDDEALRGAIQFALTDPGRLRRMGSESFRIVSEEINLEAMAAVFGRAVAAIW
jgi:glycosyltransferase involved in cell wall biosynthesis